MTMHPPKPEAKLPPRVWVREDGRYWPVLRTDTLFVSKTPKGESTLVSEWEYLSTTEHESLCQERERRARREGKIEALKFANTHTDNAYAGLIAEQAEAEKELAQSEEAPNEQR